ncbi:B12-binding domain-containing radical SAM protein [Propionispira raffinosivorans]|uniref:B12-binding domain-containing radical SAM protein n=1 Tax=Propionispira raffinosivorans TaxID=86959 RepID=UPI00036108B8|nr:radical SAM protein [Propionispira raffinosivorans]
MEANKLDILFIHPPAVINKKSNFLDADVAYSHQFVALPVGVFNMANQLELNGYSAKIFNLGEKLIELTSENDFKQILLSRIEKYKPKIVGIDIHWWVHSAGGIETARVIKAYDPKIKVVIGGITASYFAEQILEEYACVDFVLRGECDDAIISFVNECTKPIFEETNISNLTYRKNNKIYNNLIKLPQISCTFDITRYDLLLDIPIINQDRALIPITRGCTECCSYCGAAKGSYSHIMKRDTCAIIPAEILVDLIYKNKIKGRDKIYLYGDLRQGGEKYLNEFFEYFSRSEIKNIHIVFEMFYIPDIEYIQKWDSLAKEKNMSLEATISPDSGDEKSRLQIGRIYKNEDILSTCELLKTYNIPLSVYFLLGLPLDSDKTISNTLKIADNIVAIYAEKFIKNNLRHEIIGYEFMQVPDVGSEIYRNSTKYGVTIYFNKFKNMVDSIQSAKHWSKLIGFSTKYLQKNEFVEKYYYVKKEVYKLYNKYNVISNDEYNLKLNQLSLDENKSHI